MKLGQYRTGQGEYRVGDFLILRESTHSWQVRDRFGDIEQQFRTLRECIKYARTQRAIELSRNVEPTPLPITLWGVQS